MSYFEVIFFNFFLFIILNKSYTHSSFELFLIFASCTFHFLFNLGDNDAMYSCTLCCCDSTAASMFAHIKGYKHREKYLGMKYNFVSEDKKAILAEARVRTCVIFSGFPYLSTLFCYKLRTYF